MKNEPVNVSGLMVGVCHILNDEESYSLTRSDWDFDPNNALAVEVTVFTSSGEVTWRFGRDLLGLGMREDTRNKYPEGDVTIYPEDNFVYIELHSPSGWGKLRFNKPAINAFLFKTYESVPIGQEIDNEEMARELIGILSNTETE